MQGGNPVIMSVRDGNRVSTKVSLCQTSRTLQASNHAICADTRTMVRKANVHSRYFHPKGMTPEQFNEVHRLLESGKDNPLARIHRLVFPEDSDGRTSRKSPRRSRVSARY